jgi:hypothetical protein
MLAGLFTTMTILQVGTRLPGHAPPLPRPSLLQFLDNDTQRLVPVLHTVRTLSSVGCVAMFVQDHDVLYCSVTQPTLEQVFLGVILLHQPPTETSPEGSP